MQSSTPISPSPTPSFTPINLANRHPVSKANEAQAYVYPGFIPLSSANSHNSTVYTPARKKHTSANQLSTPPATDKKVSNVRKGTAKKTRALSDGLPITKPKSKPTKAEGKDVLSEASLADAGNQPAKANEAMLEEPIQLARTVMDKLASFRYHAKPTANNAGKTTDLGSPTLAADEQPNLFSDNPVAATLQYATLVASKIKPHSGTIAEVTDVSTEGGQCASVVTTPEPTMNGEQTDVLYGRDDDDFLTLFQAHNGPDHAGNEPADDEVIADGLSIDDFNLAQGGNYDREDPIQLWDDSELVEEPEVDHAQKHSKSPQGVDERFSPPSDLQYPFDDNSQTIELYDSNLKGSPVPVQISDVVTYEPEHTRCSETTSLESYLVPRTSHPTSPTQDVNGAVAGSEKATDPHAEDENWAFLDEDEVGELLDRVAAMSSPEVGTLAYPGGQKTQSQTVKSPLPGTITAPLRSVPQNGLLEWDIDEISKPFVRPSFPKRVRDRSPVLGLSSKTLLRTCFRVGEALQAGCAAARNSQDVIVELYARVTFSYREAEGRKQHFQFSDLYHDRPPFLNGIYEGWRGVGLWEYDSSLFLGEEGKGRTCRCVGRIKWAKETKGWILLVMNIWADVWDDVAFVKGIVCT
ncbi:MAG: hypothetical protein M1812_003951 [Candelaria pacifica]|nr:MAG: hypothetical protein M1812_003951 [Candelaria pacifica]